MDVTDPGRTVLKQPSRSSTLGEKIMKWEHMFLATNNYFMGRREEKEKLQKLDLSPFLDGS